MYMCYIKQQMKSNYSDKELFIDQIVVSLSVIVKQHFISFLWLLDLSHYAYMLIIIQWMLFQWMLYFVLTVYKSRLKKPVRYTFAYHTLLLFVVLVFLVFFFVI